MEELYASLSLQTYVRVTIKQSLRNTKITRLGDVLFAGYAL